MSQISLTASMRSNLLSLQNTASLMSQTQERLATGKKINSAIDNPSSYYTAQSLNNRASDLSGLLDSMGQAISTVKAANEGIESITSFVTQAKALATSALDTTDISSRKQYGSEFNALLNQIDAMAKDSGYKGINLLQEDDLTVTFNETRTNKLKIEGVDAGTTGLSLSQQSWDVLATTEVTTAQSTVDAKKALYDAEKANAVSVDGAKTATAGADASHIHTADAVSSGSKAVFKVGDKYYQITADGDNVAAGEIEIGTGNNKAVLLTEGKDGLYYVDASAANGAWTTWQGAIEAYDETVVSANAAMSGTIQNAIDAATDAINTLRDYASVFGNNYSIVQTREEFTTNLINVLEEGADKLTLADMNEESANMLALQTRQQLAINSLSLASQAAQSVLKLF